MIFYKGVLKCFLDGDFTPGTVTRDFSEALTWAERISGNKSKGAAAHIKHGKSRIIEIEYDESKLKDHKEFQRPGVHEHKRHSCWTSMAKVKAQINDKVNYHILSDEEIWDLATHKK